MLPELLGYHSLYLNSPLTRPSRLFVSYC